jgi:hypothetical protein
VATDIVEGTQVAVLAADRQQTVTGHVCGDPVAGCRRLRLVTEKQPGPTENA